MSTAPTTELGSVSDSGVFPWTAFHGDNQEFVSELQWPMSVWTYSAMLNDAQIEGLYYGATLPIRRYTWMIDPNGARDEVVKQISSDLNLPIMDPDTGEPVKAPKGRAKKRFSHDRHLFHALRALVYGFYFMEQVGVIEEERWHLRKLAPRPPGTIDQIQVAEDGGLVFIKQNVGRNGTAQAAEIPVDRLVAYVWDQEGGNWVGRSMLRSIYRNWLIKDRLLRVDAIKHERNGVGMPVVEGAPGMGVADLAKLSQLAQSYKAGEGGGGAIPSGAKLTLQGTQGTLPDTIKSIRFHNEEMARRFLMMFMQLGQTETGSRALGSEFLDYFALAQESIANWYRDITNEHVIEDAVDYNFPDEEFVPLLTYSKHDAIDGAVQPLASAINSGGVQVDQQLNNAVKAAVDEARVRQASVANRQSPPAGVRKRQGRTVEAGSLRLPDRPLRREPYEFEVTAQVDFATMEDQWQSHLDSIFERWKTDVTAPQIDALAEKISKTASLKRLASLDAPATGQGILLEAMAAMFHDGVDGAVAEAAAQGKLISPPGIDAALESLASRAQAVDDTLARALAGMAGSKAISLTGGSLTKSEVASHVNDYLSGLSHQMVKDRLQGAMTTALNTGRKAVMNAGTPLRVYASELLDANTCVPCSQIDGTEFKTMADAEYEYATGGFNDCSGGDRCRGTLVAVYAEDNAA